MGSAVSRKEVSMATSTRPGKRPLTVELPEDLARRLDELSRQTRRPLAAEVLLALEFWLERQGVGESAVEEEVKPSPRPARPQ
jgi:hypothetical protein